MLKTLRYSIQRFLRKPRHKAVKREINQLFNIMLHMNGGNKMYSQTGQDVFALIANGFKRNGFFVDFGATNGIDINNSYLLEKDYDWQGILAEPARVWHDELKANRTAVIETNCVWSNTGTELQFDMTDNGELSTISSFANSDSLASKRKKKQSYNVTTISLHDLLVKYSAPKVVDFLSIDTEGSEYDILKNFDFDSFQFNVISVEHNYTDARAKICQLLEKNGYRRVLKNLSRQDDWYVHNSLKLPQQLIR